MMRRYRYELGGVSAGPATSRMSSCPSGAATRPARTFDIVDAQGCDVAPVDLTDPAQALRLKAYIWPEFTERFARMDAAIDAANSFPPEIARMRAVDFLQRQLGKPRKEGATRVLMHSVVWQDLPAEERERITALMEDAGARATAVAPLAWVSLEANRDTHRHELSVRYWPGGEEWRQLATAHPHGAWNEWSG